MSGYRNEWASCLWIILERAAARTKFTTVRTTRVICCSNCFCPSVCLSHCTALKTVECHQIFIQLPLTFATHFLAKFRLSFPITLRRYTRKFTRFSIAVYYIVNWTYVNTIHQHRQTDGRTDGRHTTAIPRYAHVWCASCGNQSIQESCAIAKMTARCALYK